MEQRSLLRGVAAAPAPQPMEDEHRKHWDDFLRKCNFPVLPVRPPSARGASLVVSWPDHLCSLPLVAEACAMSVHESFKARLACILLVQAEVRPTRAKLGRAHPQGWTRIHPLGPTPVEAALADVNTILA